VKTLFLLACCLIAAAAPFLALRSIPDPKRRSTDVPDDIA